MLTGIDRAFYQNAYPVTAVTYSLYPIRDPDPDFKGALRGQGLKPARQRKIQEWENGVYEVGATVDDVAELERILKRAIILMDIGREGHIQQRKVPEGWQWGQG